MKQFIFILICFLFFSAEAQQINTVDFKTITANLEVSSSKKGLGGEVITTFKILKNCDSITIDAKNFKHVDFELNKGAVSYNYNQKQIIVKHDFKKGSSHSLLIKYYTEPKKALYFVGDQVWSQGQGKYTSNWLPSIDNTNDKIKFDLAITYKNNFQVVANGKLVKKEVGKTTTKWLYRMKKPMSSYLVALAIGKYNKKEITSKCGTPITLYYYPEDTAKVEPTYRYTKQLFNFLETEIGVPYPWQNYKQVPVKDFLYSGMENTSLTIFSDDFMIDSPSFIDKNYVNVNAHELAHQWFGDLVTATESKHHWLQEGFATYYALLAERDIFGDDYYYWHLYQYAQELKAQENAGHSTALLNPKASSTTFYKKGAWALHILKEKIGEKAFKKAVKNYLKKYKFKNVETIDFIAEAEKASGKNLSCFVKTWLNLIKLPINEMEDALDKNETSAFLLKTEKNKFSSNVYNKLPESFHAVKSAILNQVLSKPNYLKHIDLIEEAFNSNNLKVRQTLAQGLTEIPLNLKTDYESLLNDASYLTKEMALYNLWNSFPQEQKKYLDKTKGIQGFNDKNVRTLWLVLALNTKNYNNEKKQSYYKELVNYTAPNYNFRLRKNAFSYLKSIDAFNEKALLNLINASKHHTWRFKSFSRNLLKSLSKDKKYKSIISNLQQK